RRGGTGEAAARAGLLGVPAGRLGLAAAAAAAARAVGGAQVHLAGEPAGALVVLDAGDHRMRAAGLVLVAGLVVGARGGRLGMAVAMTLAGQVFLGHRQGRGGAFGFGAGSLFLGALALGGFLGPALVGFGQALLLGQVALARFLELAQDLGAFVVLRRGLGDYRLGGALGRLDQGDLLAHDHVD